MKVLVVSEDVDDELRSKEEVAPVLKRADDGEEFAIPDRVVTFGLGEGGGIVTHRVAQSVRIALVEDGACGKLGGVYFKLERFIVVRLPEDGIGGGKVNKAVEGRSAFWGPEEGCPLFKEI